MSYLYIAYIGINDKDGRSLNLLQAPTITVWNGRAKTQISSPSPTWTYITVGLYAVEIEIATKTDVLFKLVPHNDDKAAVHDIRVIHESYIETVGEVATDYARRTGDYAPAAEYDAELAAIQAKTDELTFTTPNRVDASADVDAQDIRDSIGLASANLDQQFLNTIAWQATRLSERITEGQIVSIRGNNWHIVLEDMVLDSHLIQVAIKSSEDDADKHAMVMWQSGAGLLYLNGAEAVASQGTLTYEGTTLIIDLVAAAAAQVAGGTYFYGIQSVSAEGVVLEPYKGKWTVAADVVRRVG